MRMKRQFNFTKKAVGDARAKNPIRSEAAAMTGGTITKSVYGGA